jgi:hypothetical protein
MLLSDLADGMTGTAANLTSSHFILWIRPVKRVETQPMQAFVAASKGRS